MAEPDNFNWIDDLTFIDDAYPDGINARHTGPESPTSPLVHTLALPAVEDVDLDMFDDSVSDPESPGTTQSAKKARLDDLFFSSGQDGAEGNDPTISESVTDKQGSTNTESHTTPTPRLVEILRGRYNRYLFNFTDKDVFIVKDHDEDDSASVDDFVVRLKNDVTVTVDLALLEEKVKNGQVEDSDITRFLRLILRTANIINIEAYDQPTPAAKIKYVPQPEAIRLNLKQYQLDTLGLMELVESQVDKRWRIPKLMDWKAGNDSITVDVNKRKVYFPPTDSLSDTKYSVNIKGGILADEMGLGKTVTMLALISVHQFPDTTNVSLQETFRVGEEELLHTRATLVIAPNHLTAQWKHEAQQHAPGLNFVMITTKRQFERVSYEDIMQCDLVVVSVQFLLENKAYRTMPTGEEARTSLEQLFQNSDNNPLKQTCPNFCHFNWWRLVCDEAHELITYMSQKSMRYSELTISRKRQLRTGLRTLETLHGKHKWYLSGTPFPHAGKSLRGALKFLEMKVDEPKLMHGDGSLKIDDDISSWEDFYGSSLDFSPIHMFILETIYIRNTKKSVQLEYDVPEYIEELMLLAQSEVEVGVYDQAATELERRQLCCHLQIAHHMQSIVGVKQKSLEEVKSAMIDESKNKIEKMTKLIDQAEKDMEYACNEFPSTQTTDILLNNRIIEYVDKIESYEEILTKHKSSLSYFESIVPRITHSAEESCAICLDDIQRLTLTPCGHMYCRKCILACLQETKNCPSCRKDMRESDLIEIKDPDQQEEIRNSTELGILTEQYGTKMAHLIFFLRHLFQDEPSSRVIIFSQWDDMLHKISSTLDANKIGNVFVKGNVHIRNKAIASFKEKKTVRVIMLSLQNAASGTNLVEASHVILIDPVAGSKADAVAIESQAIGRAHRIGQRKEIRVVRMIMKDTIEHDLYSRNTADNIQVELNFDWEISNTHGPKVIRKLRKVIASNEVTIPEPRRPDAEFEDGRSDTNT